MGWDSFGVRRAGHAHRFPRSRPRGEQCTAGRPQPSAQLSHVADGEGLAGGVVPLHCDGDAVLECVEKPAGEGVLDGGVPDAKCLHVPLSQRGRVRWHGRERFFHCRLPLKEGESSLQCCGELAHIVCVELHHLGVVPLARKLGGADPLRLRCHIDALARLCLNGGRRPAGGEGVHLRLQGREQALHLWEAHQPSHQLEANRVLPAAPPSPVVGVLVVERVRPRVERLHRDHLLLCTDGGFVGGEVEDDHPLMLAERPVHLHLDHIAEAAHLLPHCRFADAILRSEEAQLAHELLWQGRDLLQLQHRRADCRCVELVHRGQGALEGGVLFL